MHFLVFLDAIPLISTIESICTKLEINRNCLLLVFVTLLKFKLVVLQVHSALVQAITFLEYLRI